MRTGLLVSRNDPLAARLKRVLEGALALVRSPGLEQSSPLPIDLVLIDVGSASVESDDLTAVRGRYPQAFVVAVVSTDEPAMPGIERCDLVIPRDLPDPALRAAIEQALRFQRLSQEVAALRRERARPAASAPPATANGGSLQGTVLKEVGKLLATHFDLDRVVDFFLDAIAELVRPGRSALRLADNDGRYRLRGHRGLDPVLSDHLRLDPAEGLPAWLRHHARLAVGRELNREPEWLDAARELDLMGGEVAVPLWVQAKLVGILVLGPRVTGQAYAGEDLERLFTLAGQVALAVEDISLFNAVRAQHNFVEQVLAQLQSGAITIDTSGRITLINRRAEEILSLSRSEVLGRDLRALPSPIGDLLYDTLRNGRELRLQEITPTRRPTAPLEVSTSRILGAAGQAVGAVMILDDPTPRRLLHRERQASQTVDLLNRVLLRLTDEIKNPLVSIYTFLELLPQRYDDLEFREKFFSVVSQDTQNLISLVDKLIILAGERDYKVEFCHLRELLNDALENLALRFERPRVSQEATIFLLQVPERSDRLTTVLYTPDADLVVRADRDQLGKAIGYLLRFLMSRVASDGRVAIHAVPDPDDPRTIRVSILGKPATLAASERERLFSPLAIASERLLDVGPSVSQKIVEGHGGTLAVGGDEGEIRFVMTLPRTTQ
ncbi:MAG: PAS domain-containing protein [Candidatus Rokuibacteriota bacterium]